MTPALSYTIPCGQWRHVARVVDCLLAQEEADRSELVLAGPARTSSISPTSSCASRQSTTRAQWCQPAQGIM